MVMIQRRLAGRPIFSPDKNHFHHKLMKIGFFHSESVMVIYAIQAVLVSFGYVFRFYSEWLLLGFYLIFTGAIFAVLCTASRRHWALNRPGIFDRLVKERLRIIKEEQTVIRASFVTMEMLLPLMVLITCFIPARISGWAAGMSLAGAVLMVTAGVFHRNWAGSAMRVLLYVMLAYLVYASEISQLAWVTPAAFKYYHLAFGVLAMLVLVTIKFTRRRKGFMTTPLDFLIIFVAVIIPNLPDPRIQSYHLGMITTKLIVFFFSYEVWICESRGRLTRPGLSVVAGLVVLAVRGGLGI